MNDAVVALDDKYALDSGRVFLSGTQALVRLPMLQRRRDAAAGLKTGVFVSGYRGSPLGTYDKALWQARAFLARHDIHFRPGVNEDLAATAVWGSQQLGMLGPTRYDGVVGIWYGKGPGVDRCGDAIRHANSAGTARHGGVLMLLGDDHGAKSSTLPHQSDFAMVDAMIPVLHPAGVQEFLDLGIHGIAASRWAGLWVGFKCVTAIVDSSATVDIDPGRLETATPDGFDMPAGGLNARWPDDRFEAEERLHEAKLAAMQAYARHNRLDRLIYDSPGARIGVVASGKAYLDVMQALDDLGIDKELARALGLRLYKVALAWPLEPEGLRRFADGLEQIVVVEEKRGLIEEQIKSLLYGAEGAPVVVGKRDETGAVLFPAPRELTADRIAEVLGRRLAARDPGGRLSNRLDRCAARAPGGASGSQVVRTPYFCSGCPHNTSTRVPEGSRALSGIGCHFLAQYMNRNTASYSHMGGEGVPWIGQAPFADEKHVFVNIGDGTYFHSGLLAIRAAVAAGVSVTYKILYNDAVAMTGGQPVDGSLSVAQITHQLHGEGVRRHRRRRRRPGQVPRRRRLRRRHPRLAPRVARRGAARAARGRGRDGADLRPGLRHREAAPAQARPHGRPGPLGGHQRPRLRGLRRLLDGVELRLGRAAGDAVRAQAADQPLLLQQGLLVPRRVLPELRHRRGRRPAHRRRRRQSRASGRRPTPGRCPSRRAPTLDEPVNILVTGIGGTGVVTIGAVLGMAAHIDGKACTVLDTVGAAQKGGAVMSQIRLAADAERLHALAIGRGRADLLLGCDIVVAASRDSLDRLSAERSAAVVNAHNAPVAAFVHDPDFDFAGDVNRALIGKAAAAGQDPLRRRDGAGHIAVRRRHRQQHVPARARLSAGARARRRRRDRAGDHPERRRGGDESRRLRLGPPGGDRARGRRRDAQPRAGVRGGGGRSRGARGRRRGPHRRPPRGVPRRLSERGLGRTLPPPRRPRPRRRGGLRPRQPRASPPRSRAAPSS